MTNILITSAGRRVSLVQAFINELKNLNINVHVYTTDLNPSESAAAHISYKGLKVGKFSDPNYIPDLLKLCFEHKIKIIIPTIDTELYQLATHKEFFKKEGIDLLVSDQAFIKICRDKRLTNQFFNANGIMTPKAIDPLNPSFPLFIKPISGSMSKDIYLINDPSTLTDQLLRRDDLMYMEYLSKEEFNEFTLDLYYDKQHVLQCVVPRLRLEVRSGEISKGLIVKNMLINFIKERLGYINGAVGCITLQLFLHKLNGNIFGIEINPRFGGGYPMSYIAGANYPKWIIQEYYLDKKLDWFDSWEDNLLLLRYDKEIVVRGYKG